jgi:hypothetical protein
MKSSETAGTASVDRRRAERLEIARRVYQALVVQDADRIIRLCDSDGKVIARHDPRSDRAEIAS